MDTERILFSSTERPSRSSPLRVDTTERHESFGLVSVSRVHGGRERLFGSDLDYHPTRFMFMVKRAKRIHTALACDRHYMDSDAETPELIEFELSATQFVELMTSLNIGEGVPCTLKWVMGTEMEPVPAEHETEARLIADNFQKEMKDIAASVKPMTDRIDTVLAKKTIGKADRETIASAVFHIVKSFDDHAPFVMNQWIKSTDRMVTAAKGEVEAFATSVIMAAGIEHLRQLKERGGDDAVLQAVGALDIEALTPAIEGGDRG